MEAANHTQQANQAVDRLEKAFSAYLDALGEVVRLGDESIPALLAALNHKRAMPIAQALGYLMRSAAAEAAIPELLHWVVGCWPVHRDAFDALVRAGDRACPYVLAELERRAQQNDAEAVRHLLELAVELSGAAGEEMVERILPLLRHADAAIREVAADALWHIGLPGGRSAIPALQELANNDPEGFVREAAQDALIRLGDTASAVPTS